MAIFEKTIRNKNFDELLWKLEKEIPDSSTSKSTITQLLHTPAGNPKTVARFFIP